MNLYILEDYIKKCGSVKQAAAVLGVTRQALYMNSDAIVIDGVMYRPVKRKKNAPRQDYGVLNASQQI